MKYLMWTAIAQICHELNRSYCRTIGDPIPVAWGALPIELQKSIIHGVKAHGENPNLTPEESHQVWVCYRELQGWTWGKRDEEKKTHPCMSSWGNLPETQRVKDRLFGAICKVLLKEG